MLLGRTKIDRGSAATVASDSLTGDVTLELVTKEVFCFGLIFFFFFLVGGVAVWGGSSAVNRLSSK